MIWRETITGKEAAVEKAPFDQDELVAAYTRFDAGRNRGRGNSANPDSGALGWGESTILDGYVKLYEATGDTAWLDRIVAHFDRMIANRKDHYADGYDTWVTTTYAVGLVRTGRFHCQSTARIAPEEARVWTSRGGEKVRNGEWVLEIDRGSKYRLLEYGTRKQVAKGSFRSGVAITSLPPFELTIEGKALPGDRFWIQSTGAEPQEYIVHQGMFLHPISRFVAHALKDRGLKRRYGKVAKTYLDLIGTIADKHDRDWLDTTASAGGYRFPALKTDRFPNRILPHNQYLAIARAYLYASGVSRKRLLGDRAARMGRNFKRHIWKTGKAYTWHYWDWIEDGEAGCSGVEDTGHGHIDIGFAVDACRKGVVFTDADLKRFARTFLDQMWNGSLDDPTIGGRVDTREGNSAPMGDWIDLCQWNAKVWDVVWSAYCKRGRPVEAVPSILQGWSRLQEGKASRRKK